MVALNKLSLAVCLVFGLCIFLMGVHIDTQAKRLYSQRESIIILKETHSTDSCTIIKLTLKMYDMDVRDNLIMNENYKLKRK